jgi:hypothetical protein
VRLKLDAIERKFGGQVRAPSGATPPQARRCSRAPLLSLLLSLLLPLLLSLLLLLLSLLSRARPAAAASGARSRDRPGLGGG